MKAAFVLFSQHAEGLRVAAYPPAFGSNTEALVVVELGGDLRLHLTVAQLDELLPKLISVRAVAAAFDAAADPAGGTR